MNNIFTLARTDVRPTTHAVLGSNMRTEAEAGQEVIYLAAGCFWGVEKALWNAPGVVTTATGYMGLLSYDGPRGDRARRLRHVTDERGRPDSSLL